MLNGSLYLNTYLYTLMALWKSNVPAIIWLYKTASKNKAKLCQYKSNQEVQLVIFIILPWWASKNINFKNLPEFFDHGILTGRALKLTLFEVFFLCIEHVAGKGFLISHIICPHRLVCRW